MIEIKILSYHSAQRYAVRQTVISAQRILRNEFPDLSVVITELKDWQHIELYTPILAAPSLVINERLVCKGRSPTREEVIHWLREVMSM